MKKNNVTNIISGFTLIEIVITVGVATILMTIVTLSLFQSRASASLDTTADQLMSDVRQQQMAAMFGATSSAGVYDDYSIRFDSSSYTLFPGDIYTSTNSANYVVPLDGALRFSATTFPSGVLTFSRLSGDVRTYQVGHDTVTLSDTQTNNTRVFQLNRRGIFVKGL